MLLLPILSLKILMYYCNIIIIIIITINIKFFAYMLQK